MAENKNVLSSFGGIAVLCIGAWYFFGGGLEQQAARDLGNIENEVARDAVDQYQIAKRSGTPIDACVHAGLVAAAYLQAKDENQYQTWKGREKDDCGAAGAP